jgi:uridine kinase
VDARRKLVSRLAGEITALVAAPIGRVGIDGIDGAGKTMFADELAVELRRLGREVIRASVDGFHHPRAIRYRRGRFSPEGYFRDSYDYRALQSALLDPLSPGGSRKYRSAVFDYRIDAVVSAEEILAPAGAVLAFDGIFLHRPELRGYWDYSIFLDVSFEVACARMVKRDGAASADPSAESNRRYLEGQKMYLAECEPARWATVVIDNNDFSSPQIVRS